MESNDQRKAGGVPRSPARTGHAHGRMLLRYALFQIPELAFVSLTLALAVEWSWLTPATAFAVLGAWILKDALLFPFVRSAYEPHDGRLPRDPRGQIGVAPDGFEDEGYIMLGPERWRSRRSKGSRPIEPGSAVRVVALHGLTVEVEAWSASIEGAAAVEGAAAEKTTA